jgi:response regulator RpfG family c-di-GMP phosphodiesterase
MAKKILLIEDDPKVSSSLNELLQATYEVTVADHGKTGLEYAKKNQPDLVVLDVKLPDMMGTDVLHQLTSDPATENIPVIVLTNLDDQHTVSSIIAAGGREYLVKTDWSLQEVVNKISEMVR